MSLLTSFEHLQHKTLAEEAFNRSRRRCMHSRFISFSLLHDKIEYKFRLSVLCGWLQDDSDVVFCTNKFKCVIV